MNQAVHAGNDLGKCAEGHQLHNLSRNHIANGELIQEMIPGIGLRRLAAQGDLPLLGVKGEDKDINLVAHLYHICRSLNPAPSQLRHMDHTVHAADVHKCAIGHQGLHHAVVLLAHFDLIPDLLNGSLPGFCCHGPDGANDSPAGTVDLGDLHLHSLAHHAGHIAALGNAGLRGGNKHPDALHVGNQAALVHFRDLAFHHSLAFAALAYIVPDFQAIQLLLAQLAGTLLVVDPDHKDLNLVAHLQDLFRLDGRICADFVAGNITGMLGAQVHLDLGGADVGDNAGYLISCI